MLYYKILYHSAFGCFTLASDEHYIKMLAFGKHLPENVPMDSEKPLQYLLCQTVQRFPKPFGSSFSGSHTARICPMAHWLRHWESQRPPAL